LLLTAVHGRDSAPATQLEEHVTLARTAEASGFDLLMVGQHYLSDTLRFYQPFPYLAYFASLFPSMRLGTGILLLPLANPVDVAENMATLDVLCGGRSVMGIGLGYAPKEFEAFGVDRRQRGSRLEESLMLIRQLWSGEPVSHQGSWSVDTNGASVVPLQGRDLPVWIAGQSEKSVTRVGRLGAAWYVPPFISGTELRDLAAIYHGARHDAGFGPATTFPLRREVYLAQSVEEAVRRVKPFAADRVRTYLDWGLGRTLAADSSFGSAEDRSVTDRFVLGPAETCAEQLLALFEEHSVSDFVIKVQWPGMEFEESLHQLEWFASEVVPLLSSPVGIK
jgi:alkanesulfonate monooxygenase SsuD/methylene tetrahydromethanopterin reductase-like flavin-dependent oxidoreductase (luciferase family)